MKRIISFIFLFSLIFSCSSIDKNRENKLLIEEIENLKKEIERANSSVEIDYTIRPKKYEDEVEIKENTINYYNHIKNIDEIENNYTESINFIKDNDNAQFIYTPSENILNIAEYRLSNNVENKIREMVSDVDFKGSLTGDNENHAVDVLRAFLNVNRNPLNYKEKKPENLKLKMTYGTYKRISNLTGIINMSYGNADSNLFLNNIKKDKIYKENEEYNDTSNDAFSNLVTKKDYFNNMQLKVISLGNGPSDFNRNKNEKNTSNIFFNTYSIMSPEIQKKSRSETIFVKSILSEDYVNSISNGRNRFNRLVFVDSDDKKYYSQSSSNSNKYDTVPLTLRSFTVSEEGYISSVKKGYISYGSSFAAPKVSRLAYELKEKYPFLTYHQVKQIILTTAKRDKSGFLNNVTGWGFVDYEKALKGPSDFNAGLIDEQKFFLGMPSRIFDKDGNRYFYVNIDNEKEYVWENDITSGLKGDGESLETDNISLRGTSNFGAGDKIAEFRIPRVLDSEKLFYANIAKAGLRKDGHGTLILTGKQIYDTKTEVIEGKLVLKNISNSEYVIHNNGTLEIASNANTIDVNNNITNFGKVNFNSNVNMGHYISNGTTILHSDKILNAYSFVSNDDIIIDFKKSKNIDKIISSKNIVINNSKLKNIYLEFFSPKDSESVYIKPKRPRIISRLSKEELRNIPTYNINESRFFDAFNDETIYYTLGNIVANNEMEAKKEIFSTVYNDYISTLFDIKDEINMNIENLDNEISNKKHGIYYKNLFSSNIFESDISKEFKEFHMGNLLGYDFNDKIYKIGFNVGHYYADYNFKNYSKIKSNNIVGGIKSKISYKDFNLLSNINLYYINSKINRKILEKEATNNNNSILFNISNKISYNFKWNNISLSSKYSL